MGGHSTIPNNNVLLRVLGLFKLDAPPACVPRSDFQSALEVANALGVDDEDHMFIFDLSTGTLHDTYKANVVQQQ